MSLLGSKSDSMKAIVILSCHLFVIFQWIFQSIIFCNLQEFWLNFNVTAFLREISSHQSKLLSWGRTSAFITIFTSMWTIPFIFFSILGIFVCPLEILYGFPQGLRCLILLLPGPGTSGLVDEFQRIRFICKIIFFIFGLLTNYRKRKNW